MAVAGTAKRGEQKNRAGLAQNRWEIALCYSWIESLMKNAKDVCGRVKMNQNDDKGLVYHFFYGFGIGVKWILIALCAGILTGLFAGTAVAFYNIAMNFFI